MHKWDVHFVFEVPYKDSSFKLVPAKKHGCDCQLFSRKLQTYMNPKSACITRWATQSLSEHLVVIPSVIVFYVVWFYFFP